MNIYGLRRYGVNFRLLANDKYLAEHYERGELQEHHMLDWIIDRIPRGGVWVDVGACNAQHSLVFATKADLVVAMEPIDANYRTSVLNLGLNPQQGRRVMLLNMGAGARRHTAKPRKGGAGENSQWQLEPDAEAGEIMVVPLDSILSGQLPIAVLKIDVEGMEREVLNGAERIIAEHRPEIFVEVWEEEDMRRIEEDLKPHGYRLIERFNVVPTYHFSASGRYPVTYKPPVK